MRKTGLFLSLASVLFTMNCFTAESSKGWKKIFDGKTLNGWKANERQDWKVVDGAITGNGGRNHLFYVEEEYKNFEFVADVKTEPHSNSGIFFHTKFQDRGWPAHGYECQVNITHGDPVKTGSLYNTCLINEHQISCKDNQWWTQHIIVKGNRVIVKLYPKTKSLKEINANPFDKYTVINFMEPKGIAGTRKLSKGLFALQQHDPNSHVYYKNIYVKKLP